MLMPIFKCSPAIEARPPNFVILFADDLGYADLGCFGAGARVSPHLDRMAEGGMRFSNFYAAQAVCSASRAALLTGCYPNRIGIRGALGPRSPVGIHDAEVTLAELLKTRGYATAIYGKWHLGDASQFLPTRHGFDEFFGLPYSNDMWPHHPTAGTNYPPLPLLQGERVLELMPDQTQLTRRYTEHAVRFIQANKQRPFFLYLAQSMPHVPLHVSRKYRGQSSWGLYGDVIREIDDSAGRVLRTLRQEGLEENTLVVFTSDNGPWLSYGNHAGSAGPLREGKGTTFEGGMRVPCVMRWPGRIPAGTVCHEVAATIDLYPTLAFLAGAELPQDRVVDGRNLWALMTSQPGARSPHEAFYYYWDQGLQAVRSGPWKLHLAHPYPGLQSPGGDGKPGQYATRQIELSLFNLDRDIGEKTNVIARYPEEAARLQALAERAREDLGDSLTGRRGRGLRPSGRVVSPAVSSGISRPQGLPKIRIAKGRLGFETEDGRPFYPVGVNYFRPGSGWAPQVWKQFDAEATRRDFARMREMGVNCVRVFLTLGSFFTNPNALAPQGLERFDRFLEIAEEHGIYVHPTGPDHWEGIPEWARGDRIADERFLTALETFWRQLAQRYQGRGVIFAYDLLNEPAVSWDTPALRRRWQRWWMARYGSEEKARAAWGWPPPPAGLELPAPPPAQDAPGSPHLLDYQHFREDVAEEWTRRQVQAIKASDDQALVTVGLIQWSVPALLPAVSQYSGFRPERQARWLDFLEIHFYPLEHGFYEYTDADAEQRNLAYLECVVREVAKAGKGVVVAEFGWYGGGRLTIDQGRHPAATEAQQAQWCRRVISTTRELACGWLNWGFYDHPEARDVTQFTGLLTAEGREKEWGREFRRIASEVALGGFHRNMTNERPALNWDLAITSCAAGQQFRDTYRQAFHSNQEKTSPR